MGYALLLRDAYQIETQLPDGFSGAIRKEIWPCRRIALAPRGQV
jgi:hypothetical protein